MKIRIGNDFRYNWLILWNEEAESFTDATDKRLTVTSYGRATELVEGTDYTITGNTIAIDFTPAICDRTGSYNLEFHYTKPSDKFIDGDRRSAVDVDAFIIVPKTEQSDALEDITQTSDAVATFLDIAYQKLDAIEASEELRETAEAGRITSEGLRVTAETGRTTAEGVRVTNEQGRIAAEVLRQANIQDAIDAAALANTKAGLADTAATAANTAAGLADTARTELTTAVNTKLGEADDKIEEMDTTLSTYDGRVTAVEDDLVQLAGDVSLLDAVQGAKIKDIENVLSTANIGQSAKISVTGTSPLSLPKNAANSGMSVKMEGLTQDVGGVITHFEPTGRVRSVDKSGLNPTALYLTAPELRSNGLVKDEIRKGANGYELVKRVGIGYATTGADVLTNKDYLNSLWTTSGTITKDSSSSFTSVGNGGLRITDSGLIIGKWYVLSFSATTTASSVDVYNNWRGSLEDVITTGNGLYLFKAVDRGLYIRNEGGGTTTVNTLTAIEVASFADGTPVSPSMVTNVNYTLATPVISPVNYGGILNSAENGTVYHEPVIADAGVYGTNMPILLTDYPIASLEEIIIHKDGIDTYLDVSTAVIAGDKLSFTHPSLANGDLVLFTYAYNKESTNGNITATFYDSNVVKIDTVTGKAYKITDVVTNGVLTRTLTEV